MVKFSGHYLFHFKLHCTYKCPVGKYPFFVAINFNGYNISPNLAMTEIMEPMSATAENSRFDLELPLLHVNTGWQILGEYQADSVLASLLHVSRWYLNWLLAISSAVYWPYALTLAYLPPAPCQVEGLSVLKNRVSRGSQTYWKPLPCCCCCRPSFCNTFTYISKYRKLCWAGDQSHDMHAVIDPIWHYFEFPANFLSKLIYILPAFFYRNRGPTSNQHM